MSTHYLLLDAQVEGPGQNGELFEQFLPKPRPLPGVVELLRFLRQNKIIHGLATSNYRPHINTSPKALGIPKETVVVESGDVARAKPEPDLFLEWQERLGVDVKDCYVIGDAVWDLMAARRMIRSNAVDYYDREE